MMTKQSIDTDQKEYLRCVDSAFGFAIAKKLTEFKTSENGFRTAGTTAEKEAAEWIGQTMQEAGLTNVTIESFDADAWEFHDATVELTDDAGNTSRLEAGSFPGLPDFSPKDISGLLVYAAEGTADAYEELDVSGKIVLIDTDAYHSWWYGVLFAQAQAHGARGIICAITDHGPGTYNDDLITIQTVQGFAKIPAVIINRKDSVMLRQALAESKESITATLHLDIRTGPAKAHYVYGKIEGKNKDSLIIFNGHHDAFWDGFLDNASSLGSMMTIAKAMIESGYQPESTILFLTNGAEEYGREDSFFDYCTGATAIVRQHPEWCRQTKACINFELTAIDQTEEVTMTVTAGYAAWFRKLLKQLLPEKDHYVIPTSMAGADNIVFTKAGIPTCMNISTYFDDSSPEAASRYDHTQYDNVDRYDEAAFDRANRLYGLLAISVDKMPVVPLDSGAYLEKYESDLTTESAVEDYPRIQELRNTLKRLSWNAAGLRALSEKDNEPSKRAVDITRSLLEINRLFVHDIYKYNAGLDLIIGHSQPLSYVSAIDALIKDLENDRADALDRILAIDQNELIPCFDKEVYSEMVLKAFASDSALEWGKGHVLPQPDMYDVCKSILQKKENGIMDFAEECRTLREVRNTQWMQLLRVLDHELEVLKEIEMKADKLINKDGNMPAKDEMLSWIRGFTKWPQRMTGTPEAKASAEYVRDTFRELCLQEVAIEKVPSVCHFTETCRLQVKGRQIECHPANGTNRADETGRFETKAEDTEIIYLGSGTEEDFENVDITGKIVVCDCYFKPHRHMDYMRFFDGATVYDPENKLKKEWNIYNIYSPNDWPFNYLRAYQKGAAGFVGALQNFMDGHYDHEDYSDIVEMDGYQEMAAVWVSRKDGEYLKSISGAKASLEVTTLYEYRNALNVKGIVKGLSDDIVVIHSHHDATCRGAVQDASGMSVVFALAKYFASLPKEELKTTVMFLATDSHYTDYEGHVGFLDQREKNGEKIIMDFAVEHIGKAMELDEDNNIILYNESEARQIYVSKIDHLPQKVHELVAKYGLEKMMILPVETGKERAYQSGDVNSDAYDFNGRGIPVVSLISAPMYLYHDSDDIDKVHEDSLVPVAKMYMELLEQVWDILGY